MIVRVWGTVNSTFVEFTPIPDKPGYWEGYVPRVPGIQDIEIWAESSTGARGHLQCTVQVREAHVHTEAYLVLLPWTAHIVEMYSVDMVSWAYRTQLGRCRKVVV